MKIDSANRPYHLCFETLASELRIKILDELKKEPLSVEDISKRVGAERSTVSHSLKMLRDCSYVNVQKHGKMRVYSLKSNDFEAVVVTRPANRANVFHVINNHIECHCNNDCKKMRA